MYYILNLGISLCMPTFNALTAKNANPNNMGEVMGISDSIISMNNAIMPVLAAGMYGIIGEKIYYIAALLPTISLYFAWKFNQQHQITSTTSKKQ